MEAYERTAVADAFDEATFPPGARILNEGDVFDLMPGFTCKTTPGQPYSNNLHAVTLSGPWLDEARLREGAPIERRGDGPHAATGHHSHSEGLGQAPCQS